MRAGGRERGREIYAARAGQEGARGVSTPAGPGAARMEIRPDRIKAVAGKTLGKIHRYTLISNPPDSGSPTFPGFPAVLGTVLLIISTH